jgi:catechol 2,3-dioxygenase-like lactoylglutathione lyase family enzyme
MLTLRDPDNTAIDLCQDCTFAKLDTNNPPFDILKLGHVAGRVEDIKRTLKFYCDLLGFRISDWLTDARVFLRCDSDHHALNFLMEEGPRLHHIAFEVQDWSELKRSMDKMAERSVRLESGPGRHMVGHNVSTYHRNSDGIRVEIFTEMDQMKNEVLGYFDPRPWHQKMPMFPQKHGPETLRNNWGVGNERKPRRPTDEVKNSK